MTKKSLSKIDVGNSSRNASKAGYSYDKAKNKIDTKLPDEHKSKDKLDLLKSYRREKGMCFKCGEKWNRQHKCPLLRSSWKSWMSLIPTALTVMI